MQAVRSSRVPGRRLYHGPRWVSPYEIERAALKRVTRSEPNEFRPSSSVVVIVPDEYKDVVVDLGAHRDRRRDEASSQHPSRWKPAE